MTRKNPTIRQNGGVLKMHGHDRIRTCDPFRVKEVLYH